MALCHAVVVLVLASGLALFSKTATAAWRDGLLLYAAGLVAPSCWTYASFREFEQRGIPVAGRVRHITMAPLTACTITLLAAVLVLLRRA